MNENEFLARLIIIQRMLLEITREIELLKTDMSKMLTSQDDSGTMEV